MLSIFPAIADFIVYTLLGLDSQLNSVQSLHFFIDNVTKIYTLVLFMIYLIALLRAGFDTGKVRSYLQGKSRAFGYLLASLFGAITPFCSCSSIPLFLGFTSARIPLGITMSFLITSPMINEVAIVLLGGLLGIKFTILYVITGILAGVLGGFFLDIIGAEAYLTDLGNQAAAKARGSQSNPLPLQEDVQQKLSFEYRHVFAKQEMLTIFKRIWKWVLIGVGIGALLHGYVPEEWITAHLGDGSWWSVPAAVVLGIPLYVNATGMIPIAESLLSKGLPIGTTLALMMSAVGASFPEFVLLRQVMRPKLLVIFFFLLLVLFTIAGWLFNAIY